MSAVEWGKAYIMYTTGFPMADWLFKEERELNPRFNELLMVSYTLASLFATLSDIDDSCRWTE